MAPTRAEILSASPPMFKSRLLNSLTRTHPVVPLVLHGPVILALAVFGVQRVDLLIAIAMMAAGYFTWTLTEYWVHRVVFHLQPRGPRSASFVWAIHGVHHDHPNDARRVVVLPVVSVPIGAAAAILFWLVLPGALWLRARHLRHHFADARGCFGVSAPYWDYVFGTSLPARTSRREPVREGDPGGEAR